jgi:hypothetical protein
VLGLSARAVGFYAAFGFPFALFCATVFFVDDTVDDAAFVRRRLRTARLLVLLSPLHVMFPLTAYGIVRDVRELAPKDGDVVRVRLSTGFLSIAGLVVSAVVFVALTRDF